MSKNINNKKVLAEKLKKHLNSAEYIFVPDLLKEGDYSPSLIYQDGKHILRERKFIDFEKELGLIWYNDLEPADWEEIINLIKKRNKEREANYQAKQKKIEDKVNSQPGLYYYYGSGSKNDRGNSSISYGDKKGRYFEIDGSENGRSFVLAINSQHPVLDNFPWKKHGYYLIKTDKPIERNDGIIRPWNDGGESNENNFHKWVEVGDKITITPYEVETDSELTETEETKSEAEKIKDCDICRKNESEMDNGTEKWYVLRRYHGQNSEILHTCSNCYKNKEQEYLQNYEFIFTFPTKDLTHDGIPFVIETIKGGKTDCYAGRKDQNGKILQQQNCPHCQPWKKHQNLNVSEMDIKSLIQYLQKYCIKEISFKNGELVITHNNNNEIISAEKINDKQELVSARNILQKTNQTKITKEDLEKMINANSNSASTKKPKSDNALWIGVGIGIVLIIGVVVGLVVSKKRKNK